MISQFHLDLMMNALYEGFAEDDIKHFYAMRGYRVQVYRNEAKDKIGLQEYDLRTTNGDRWECKQDRIWGTTGRVFLEVPHPHSQAEFFLIKTFAPAAFRRNTYLDILASRQHHQVGELGHADGIFLTLDELLELSEYYPSDIPTEARK